jgi:hypothetical protein
MLPVVINLHLELFGLSGAALAARRALQHLAGVDADTVTQYFDLHFFTSTQVVQPSL